MSRFAGAVTDLIVQASSAAADPQAIQSAAQAVRSAAAKATRAELDAGLSRLADSIASADLPVAACVASCCSAVVEQGGNPTLALDAALARLSEAMMSAQLYAEACELAAADHEDRIDSTSDDEEDVEDPIERFGESVAERIPDNAGAFRALEPLGMGAIAMLSRSLDGRQRARREFPNLLALAGDLAPYHKWASFVAKILSVLDDERILVLHPQEKKGYQISVSGIGTNVELFILMADALIGDPSQGWLSGKKPDPAVVAACRDQPVETAKGKTVNGAFNFYNWKALQPEGELPDPKDFSNSRHWIWMEGVPADIEKFEGKRVILLGPPPYARALQPGRCFDAMTAGLRVESTMSAAAVDEWLKRLNAAKR